MRAELEREYVEYVTARLPALRRVAYQLTGDAHRGDDVVQQALTRLYTRWPRARGADNLDAYSHTVLVRIFLDERRLRWSRVELVAAVPEPPDPAAVRRGGSSRPAGRAGPGAAPAAGRAGAAISRRPSG
jgi:DNA-directed RNA polymerase specialized sigma24 family protein